MLPDTEGVSNALIESILNIGRLDTNEINRLKMRVANRFFGNKIPSNSDLLSLTKGFWNPRLVENLKTKPIRSLSGVNVIAVMSKPMPCPHGRCAYCPSVIGVPQSYTGQEPSSMRGIQNGYDPYLQVSNRIKQLLQMGHRVSKIELIVQGGTFPAAPISYQKAFIKGCLDAITRKPSRSLKEAKEFSKTSIMRNVGLTVETRPDLCKEEHVNLMLDLGVTRVEIGVQNLYDEIYDINGRGHTVEDVVKAFRIARDSGLKIVAHMMPGLPGSSHEKDLNAFKRLFNDPSFKPDMIKVYPCLVLKGTEVYNRWLRGDYQPYTTEEAVKLLVEIKKMIPPWIRIMRVQRDIPARLIVAGVKKSNLRQLALKRLQEDGHRCRCIRCREVGLKIYKEGVEPHPEDIKLEDTSYHASHGEEIFIFYTDRENDALIGYLRLRIPSEKAHRPELKTEGTAVIRELRVLGPMVAVGEREENNYQHKGYGKHLVEKAEEIAETRYASEKILVLSGLGVKQYYRALGYRDEGPYLSKLISRR